LCGISFFQSFSFFFFFFLSPPPVGWFFCFLGGGGGGEQERIHTRMCVGEEVRTHTHAHTNI